MKLFICLFAIALFGGSMAQPVLAQTARIAHLSHSGSSAMLSMDEESDNFGIPYPYFVEDSLRLTSDTTALAYGRWRVYSSSSDERYKEKTKVVEFGRGYSSKNMRELVRYYQQYHPKVKLIGFDSTATPTSTPPVKIQQKSKRKKATALVGAPASPAPPTSLGLGIAVVIALAGAGWLLGERRPAQPQAA